MYKQAEKIQESKSRTIGNSVAQKKGDGKRGFGFVDNRPESITQGNSGLIIQKKIFNTIQMLSSTDLTDKVKEGSPPTYRVGQKYVKRWTAGGDEKSKEMMNDWDAADVRKPSYKREKLTDKHDWVFWSNKCKGTEFFQNSKPGKAAILKKWIDRDHGDGYLQRLSNMFRNAKMGDPQGFFEEQDNGAFEFMDIQKTGAGQMGEYAEYIDEKLRRLQE